MRNGDEEALVKNLKNTRFYRFISGPQITCLLLEYAKLSSKTSRVGCGVQGESSIIGFKGFVRYIFARLFLSLNESPCQTKKKRFLFHFKNSFCSRENQI